MAQPFHIRRCCPSAIYSGPEGLHEPANMPEDFRPWRGDVIDEISIEPRRSLDAATHEAGHAVFAHALGAKVREVCIDGQPRVRLQTGAGLSPSARVAYFLAGDIATLWKSRIIFRPHDGTLLLYLHALRRLEHGHCDYCEGMLAICRIVGASASDEAFLAEYRRVELITIDVIQRWDIQRAIRALSEELMSRGSVTGDHAHDIVGRHVAFGSVVIEGIEASSRS